MNLKNICVFTGRITKDLEPRVAGETSVLSFTVAVDRTPYKNKNGEIVKISDFVKCRVWGKSVDFMTKYFKKGSAISVTGEFRNDNYKDKNGIDRYDYYINVTGVDFPMINNSDKQSGGNGALNNAQQNYNAPQVQQNTYNQPPVAPPIMDNYEDMDFSMFNDEGTPF